MNKRMFLINTVPCLYLCLSIQLHQAPAGYVVSYSLPSGSVARFQKLQSSTSLKNDHATLHGKTTDMHSSYIQSNLRDLWVVKRCRATHINIVVITVLPSAMHTSDGSELSKGLLCDCVAQKHVVQCCYWAACSSPDNIIVRSPTRTSRRSSDDGSGLLVSLSSPR